MVIYTNVFYNTNLNEQILLKQQNGSNSNMVGYYKQSIV